MTDFPLDNSKHDPADELSGVPTSEDLASRYDELLEFLLEFTHRQAQWDQRQQQLVDFQRRAVEQLRTTSFELVDHHIELQDEQRRLGRSAPPVSASPDPTIDKVDSLQPGGGVSGGRPAMSPSEVEELEEELREKLFEQKQLTQLTRLQRRKLAQQLRAQRAEIRNQPKPKEPKEPRPSTDLTPILEQFQRELDDERTVSMESVRALRESLERSDEEKNELQRQLQERMADIDELKRLLVESQHSNAQAPPPAPSIDEEEQRRLEGEQERLNGEQDRLNEEQHRLQELEDELGRRGSEIEKLDQKTRQQRRKLTQQFRAVRAELEQQRIRNQIDSSREANENSEAIAIDVHAESMRQLAESVSSQLENRFAELREMLFPLTGDSGEEHDGPLFQTINTQLHEVKDSLAEQVAGQHSDLCERLEQMATHGDPVTPELIAEQLNAVRESLAEQINAQHSTLSESLADAHHSEAQDSEGSLSAPLFEEKLAKVRDELNEGLADRHSALLGRINQAAENQQSLADSLNEKLEQTATSQQTASQELIEQFKAELAKNLSETQKASKALERKISRASKADASAKASDAAKSEETDELRFELESVQQLLRDAEEDSSLLLKQNAELTDELEELKRNVESGAAGEQPTGGSRDADSIDELMDEVDRLQRELDRVTSENRRLNAQSSSGGGAASGGDMDWETAKQKLLAELEAFDEGEPEQQRERLSIEEVITQTDQVIAAKDEEISELKHLLSHQSESIGDVAVGASAIAGMMDNDEIIQQERENLAQLQEEWKEKLRTSEVELSLERARIARERAELEERINQLESLDPSEAPPSSDDDDDDAKSSSIRGKWLERLGLRDENK